MRRIDLFVKSFKIFGSEKDKKSWFRILYKLLNLIFVKKELPTYYFGKYIYKKEVQNYKDYLSKKETSRITQRGVFNKFDYYSILTNKISFALYFDKNNIPVPHIHSYNFKTHFFYDGQTALLTSAEILIDFYLNVFSGYLKHPLFKEIMEKIKDV